MSKLTDKIEALRKLSFFIEGQQLDQALQAILADAREIEDALHEAREGVVHTK